MGVLAAELPESDDRVRALPGLRRRHRAGRRRCASTTVLGRQRPVRRHPERQRQEDLLLPHLGEPLQHVRRQHPGQRLPVPGRPRGRARLQQPDPADRPDAHAGPEVLERPAVVVRRSGCPGRGVRLPRPSTTTRATPPTGTTPTSSGPPTRRWKSYKVHGGAEVDPAQPREVRRVRRQGHAGQVRHQPQRPDRVLRPGTLPATTPTRSPSPLRQRPAGPHRDLVLVLRREGRRGRVHACSATTPRRPRWTASPTTSRPRSSRNLWADGPIDHARRPSRPVRASPADRQRRRARRQRRLRDAADRHRHAASATSRSPPGSTRLPTAPGRGCSTSAPAPPLHVPDRQRRLRRGDSPSPPAAAARRAADQRTTGTLPLNQWSHVAVTLNGTTGTLYVNGTAVGDNTNMTLHPSEPRQHDAELDRPLAVRRPAACNATVDDFNDLQPRAERRGGHDPGRRQSRAPVTSRRTGSTRTAARPRSTPRRNGRNATINTSAPISCPGKVFLQRDLDDRQPRLLEGPAELRPVHRRHRARTPTSTSRRCATTPTRPSSRSCRPTRPTRPTRRRRSRTASTGHEQLLQHQRHAAGAPVLQGAARLPVAVHHAGHVPQARRVAELERVRQRRQPLPRQQRVLLQLEPDRRRRWAARASTTTCSARSTGCSSRTSPACRPRLDDVIELYPIDVGL